ncbi:MAG: amidohydrolase family protein [Sulfolobales archaeon]
MALIGVRGRILTLDLERPFIKNGIVVFDDKKGVIIDVTSYEKGLEYGLEYVFGSSRSLVIPGLVNTHNHIPMYIFKGISIKHTGIAWLKEIWSLESCLKPYHVRAGAMTGIAEMLLNGITLFGDMYFYEDEVVEACREAGIRASLSLGVIELFEGPPRHTIEESISFASRLSKSEGIVKGMIGIHALYSVSSDSIRKASEASKERGVGIHMHFAESKDEVDIVRKIYGTTPAKALEILGVLDTHPLLAHAVYVSNSDLEILSKYKPYISYCPFTIMSWGSGIARVAEMIERGVGITMGTDGPATAGWMNILFEIKVAIAAQGSLYSIPYRLSSQDLLRQAIVNGARALGWDDIGIIRKGFKADLVVLEPIIPISIEDHVEASHNLVYDFGLFSVRDVFVNGRHVVSNGKLLTIDLERAYIEMEKARRDIIDRCGRR